MDHRRPSLRILLYRSSSEANTRYLDAAITELRAGGHEVRAADAARLAPFGRNHINLLGRYSFLLPGDLGGGLRPLRDPSTIDSEDEDDDGLS